MLPAAGHAELSSPAQCRGHHCARQGAGSCCSGGWPMPWQGLHSHACPCTAAWATLSLSQVCGCCSSRPAALLEDGSMNVLGNDPGVVPPRAKKGLRLDGCPACLHRLLPVHGIEGVSPAALGPLRCPRCRLSPSGTRRSARTCTHRPDTNIGQTIALLRCKYC